MRILHVSPEYPLPGPSGGIASYVQDIARAQYDLGHDVKVICIDESFSSCGAVHIIQDGGAQIHFVSRAITGAAGKVLENPCLRKAVPFLFPDLKLLVPPLAALLYWRQLKKEWIPDVIEMFEWQGHGTFMAMAERNIPIVLRGGGHCRIIAATNREPWTQTLEAQHRLESRCARLASIVVPCSELLGRDEIRDFGLDPQGVTAVPMCVSQRAFSPHAMQAPDTSPAGMPDKIVRIAFAGRLEHRKGIDLLLRAGRELHEPFPFVEFILIGRESESFPNMLAEFAAHEGYRGQITLTGSLPRDRVFEIFRNCDFAVFPSRYEPFGIVALEAMACGIPVIVSDAGGWREAVKEGLTGFIVKSDDHDALQKAMSDMITLGREKRREMGARARETMKIDFSPSVIARRQIALYEKVMAKGRS